MADPEISSLFPNGATEKHRAYVVTVLGEALGGPERYRDLTLPRRTIR